MLNTHRSKLQCFSEPACTLGNVSRTFTQSTFVTQWLTVNQRIKKKIVQFIKCYIYALNCNTSNHRRQTCHHNRN